MEYWDKSVEQMMTMDSYDMYPPRITLEICPSIISKNTKAIFNFNVFEPHEALLIAGELSSISKL